MALENDKIVGFASIEGEKIGCYKQYHQLSMLHVDAHHRGKGIGRQLFQLCVEALKELGGSKLYISTSSSENTQRFYRLMGCVRATEVIPELFEREPYDRHLEFDIKIPPQIILKDSDEEYALHLRFHDDEIDFKELRDLLQIHSVRKKKVILLDDFPIGYFSYFKEESLYISHISIDFQFKAYEKSCFEAITESLLNEQVDNYMLLNNEDEKARYLEKLGYTCISTLELI